MEDPDDREAIRFADLLSSFGLDQHVKESTHRYGGTLDLVVTDSDVEVGSVTVDPPGINHLGSRPGDELSTDSSINGSFIHSIRSELEEGGQAVTLRRN